MKINLSSYFNLMLLLIGLSSLATILLLFKNIQENQHLIFSPYDLNNNQNLFNRYQTFFIKPQMGNLTNKLDDTKNFECKTSLNQSVDCVKRNGNIYLSFDYIRKKFDVSELNFKTRMII